MPGPRRSGLVWRSLALGTVLGTLLTSPGSAQHEAPPFQRLSVANGLLGSGVTALLQDQRGFIWVGTREGLSRYDGYDFRSFQPDPDNVNSLSTPRIETLFEDSRGRIWVGGWGKIDRYDPRLDRITRMTPTEDDAPSVPRFLETRSGAIWIGTRAGVFLLDSEADSLRLVRRNPPEPDSLNYYEVGGLVETGDGTVWLSTTSYNTRPPGPPALRRIEVLRPGSDAFRTESAVRTRPGTGDFTVTRNGDVWVWLDPYLERVSGVDGSRTRFLGPESSLPLDVRPHHAPAEDLKGNLWFGTFGQGLVKLDPATGQAAYWPRDPNDAGGLGYPIVHGMTLDSRGGLWMLTLRDGIRRLDPETLAFYAYQHDPDDPESIPANVSLVAMEDREGAMWFGTSNGIARLDPAAYFTSRVRLSPDVAPLHDSRMVTSMHEGAGQVVWLGAGQGLFRYDLVSGTITEQPGATIRGGFHHIIQDSQGHVWLAGHMFSPTGLSRFQPETGAFETWLPGPTFATRVNSISTDPRGFVWAVGQTGAHRFDPSTETFTSIPRVARDSLEHVFYATSILRNAAGDIWLTAQSLYRYNHDLERFDSVHVRVSPRTGSTSALGSWLGKTAVWTNWVAGGVTRHETQTGRTTVFEHVPGDPTSLASNNLLGVYVDSKGQSWIGTDNGLNRLDDATDTFTRFTAQNNGLASNRATVVGEDPAGYLWVHTSNGISILEPQGALARTLRRPSGEPSGALSGVALTLSDGSLLLGSQGGIESLQSPLSALSVLPSVSITSVQVMDPKAAGGLRVVFPEDGRRLELPFRTRDFVADFVAIHFRNPRDNRYALMLEGYHGDWQHVGTQRRAMFTNLSPGDYTLRVKASNSDGNWDENGASLGLTVLPPWWRTSWAFGLYALILGGIVLAYHRFHQDRLERIQREESALERARVLSELDQMKSDFFGNVSHEFRTPLTLAIGPVEDVLLRHADDLSDEAIEDLELAVRSGRRLQRLTDQILDVAKLEADQHKLNLEINNLGSYLADIARSFEPLARQRSLRFDVLIPDSDLWTRFDPAELDKVFLNLLSNAFKFAQRGGTVRLTAVCQEERVIVSVLNTGEGILAEQLPHVFDRFYRTPFGQDSNDPGTGIGLALAKRLVELHHGQISASSDPGVSTVFSVTLPRASSTSAPSTSRVLSKNAQKLVADLISSATAFDEEEPVESEKPTALVVDDDSDMRRYIHRRLLPRYRVIEASDGNSALELAELELPDVIISDVVMPGKDGFDLCKAIKSNETLSYLPVVLITGKTEKDARLRGLEHGADIYLTKPFDERELNLALDNLFARRKVLKLHFSGPSLELHPSAIDVPSADLAFLEQIREIIEANLDNEDFGVSELADAVGQSRSTLHRRVRELLSTTPTLLIRRFRLERAQQLLRQRAGGVSEIAFTVGYQSVSSFSRSFRAEFGETPSEYLARSNAQAPTKTSE